jgi:hypothetical protein
MACGDNEGGNTGGGWRRGGGLLWHIASPRAREPLPGHVRGRAHDGAVAPVTGVLQQEQTLRRGLLVTQPMHVRPRVPHGQHNYLQHARGIDV